MTRIECDICMTKGFLVQISEKSKKKEFLTDKLYKIVSAHKCKNRHSRTWQYSYGIAPNSNFAREIYTVPPDELIIDKKYEQLLQKYVQDTLYKNIKAYIKELIAAGVIKTVIRQKINDMLREAKKNE